MAAPRKFGTFGGVFTPSILTILGVIMYLRLPWIVGQGGMWSAIAIVLVAHLISITTGLSVASIATDKRVRAGGTYYMVSRSLGLPIGGTLGLALFVGLSFSVSLYLIGFSESFLSYWGVEVTRNSIRLAGTIALLAVTVLTFISTSLALRSQYFILTAIVLSLVSIFLGSHDFAPEQPLLSAVPSAVPWMVLFGIFFPAVTGFEAGVSMSGDLRDPKRSIPVGTIAAITVGLVTYIGLAIYFSYTVSAADLIGNPNILLEMSAVPALVIAGIWGATLSSALGSILGAPRILQAAAADRIGPRFFARGYGKDNEPRNALLMTFLIAEAGILIGELDIIARVVSMFFITTYGFLNLSSALESWASPDFRPEFRIPRAVSVIGSLACFIVMILLDFLAMVGATLVLGTLFFYLKRRELTLESGDTWEGVWSSVVRTGLQRLSRTVAHRRNWRPNIILFSGGAQARPHLLALGQWLVRKRGLLSTFELIERREAATFFAKSEQALREPGEGESGVFTRRLECRDLYEGMESVAQVYGFSGVEPNTVMMGWGRNSRQPDRFAATIGRLMQLDYNLLLLDFDRDRGYGERRQIDIWWRGGNNNAHLALILLKFLQSAEEWEEARARFLIIVSDSALINKVHRNMAALLAEHRLDGEVKVINNAVERRPPAEIIHLESRDSDLTILGLPEVSAGMGTDYVVRTSRLVDSLGTVLLVHASRYFDPLYIGIETAPPVMEAAEDRPAPPAAMLELPEALSAESHHRLEQLLHDGDRRIGDALDAYHAAALRAWSGRLAALLSDLEGVTGKIRADLNRALEQDDGVRLERALGRLPGEFLFQCRRRIEAFRESDLGAQAEEWQLAAAALLETLERWENGLPDPVPVTFSEADLAPREGDSRSLRRRKWRLRIRARLGGTATMGFPLRRQGRYLLTVDLSRALHRQAAALGLRTYRTLSDLQNWARDVNDRLETLVRQGKDAGRDEEGDPLPDTLLDPLRAHRDELGALPDEFAAEVRAVWRGGVERAARTALRPDGRRIVLREQGTARPDIERRAALATLPDAWRGTSDHMTRFAEMDLHLLAFLHRLDTIAERFQAALHLDRQEGILDLLDIVEGWLETVAAGTEREAAPDLEPPRLDAAAAAASLRADVQPALDDLPETVDVLTEAAFQSIDTTQFDDPETQRIELRRLTGFLVESELSEPVHRTLAELATTLDEILAEVRDAVRLVRIQRAESEGDGGEADRDSLATGDIVAASRLRVEKARTAVEEALAAWEAQFLAGMNRLADRLNPYLVIRQSDDLGRYIRTRDSRRMLGTVSRTRIGLQERVHGLAVRLLYRRSEGVLLARRLMGGSPRPRTALAAALTLRESVAPDPAVLQTVPEFYQRLFTGKQAIDRELWVGREGALHAAERAARRFRTNGGGALLVVGDPGSGKSALSRMAAREAYEARQVFSVFGPERPGADRAALQRAMERGLELRGAPGRMLRLLPPRSVVVFHDLEAWWERRLEGSRIVAEIAGLIREHGGRVAIIVNVNRHSYRLLRRLAPLDALFLEVLTCTPLDAEELQQALLLRHRSSGMTFELDGIEEEGLSNLRLARHFNRYFDYSGGNIGAALLGWIAHVERCQGQRLRIAAPTRPDLTLLDSLPDAWRDWLRETVLHKQIDPPRLARLFHLSGDAAADAVATLARAGLLRRGRQDAWTVDPYVQPFLVRRLFGEETP